MYGMIFRMYAMGFGLNPMVHLRNTIGSQFRNSDVVDELINRTNVYEEKRKTLLSSYPIKRSHARLQGMASPTYSGSAGR